MSATATDTPLPKARIRPGRILLWTVLFIGGVLMITPLLFMFSTSLKTAGQVYDLRLIPESPTLANYVQLLTENGFLRWFVNSTIVAICVTASNCFFDSLVGYTLAKFRFRGRQFVFIGDPVDADDPDRDAGDPLVPDVGQLRLAGQLLGHHVPRHDDRLRHLPDEAVLRDGCPTTSSRRRASTG